MNKRDKIIEILTKMSENLFDTYGSVITSMDIIEAYADELLQESEWISVEDRLPDGEDSVIAIDDKGNRFPADFYGEEEWYDLEAQCYLPSHQYVTHWMPLPKPPTKP